MTSTDALRNTLIWAAGGPGSPEPGQVGEAELLFGLRHHRLESRMLHRAREAGVTLPQSLADALARRHAEQRELVGHQSRLYGQLREALRSLSPEAGVAPVKGFSLFALTGAEQHVRHSADLDVIGSDPALVAQAALSITGAGYHHHGEDHAYVFAHMDEVEVHTRYLVTGFPEREAPHGYDVHANPGVMRLTQPFSVSAIEFPTVAKHLVDTSLGPVPGPELALLVRCAHIYVGYAMDPYPLPLATVRLDELSQMMDIVALDSFSETGFQALADEFDAGLVVSFARTLCRELLGADPFEAAGKAAAIGPVTRTWFPQNLWWDGIGAGFPVRLGDAPGELVARSAGRPPFNSELSPATIAADAHGRARVTFLGDGPDEASRYFWHAFHGGMGQIEAEFAMSEDGVRATITMPATPRDQMSMIGLASGESRVELFYKPDGDVSDFADYSFTKLAAGSAAGTGRVDGQRHVLTVDLPWAAFGRTRRPDSGEELEVIFRGRQQVRPWREVTGGVVAPLLIRC